MLTTEGGSGRGKSPCGHGDPDDGAGARSAAEVACPLQGQELIIISLVIIACA